MQHKPRNASLKAAKDLFSSMTDTQVNREHEEISEDEIFAIMGWTQNGQNDKEANVLRPPRSMIFSANTWEIEYNTGERARKDRMRSESEQPQKP